MTPRFQVGVADTQGRRQKQEDSHVVADVDATHRPFAEIDRLLVAVADGVGGEAAGEVASREAVEAFSRAVQAQRALGPVEALEEGILAANRAIHERIATQPDLAGMASTLTGIWLTADSLYWVSVGDSHLYLVSDGRIVKLNEDHSLGAHLDREAAAGNISDEEAAGTPGRNMLLSYLAGEPLRSVDLRHEPMRLHHGDRLILATDGLNTLDESEIARIASQGQDAQQCANDLVAAVEAAGHPRQDNTLVVVVDPAGGDERRDENSHSGVRLSRVGLIVLAALVTLILAGLVLR